MIFSVILVPLVGVLGISVDYALAARAKTTVDAAMDAALLAAATTASEVIQAQSTQTYTATTAAEQQGQITGNAVFQADINQIRVTSPVTFGNITWTVNGQTITATNSYTALSTNIFGQIFHDTSWQVAGMATAQVQIPAYYQIYLLVDISSSMGIAATSAGQALLYQLTPDNCELGCHTPRSPQTVSDESIAESNGIQLRIDAARTAVEDIISTASSSGGSTPRIQLGIYTLTNVITQLSAPTTNYTALQSAAQQIDLASFATNNSGPGYTYPTVLPTWVEQTLPTSGTGTSANNPLVFVFLISDGVTDYYKPCQPSPADSNNHCMGVFNSASATSPSYGECSAMIQKGVQVGVIYTTYVPIPPPYSGVPVKSGANPQSDYNFYISEVGPVYSQILPAMTACASSSKYFFQASDGTDIINAANALFAAATTEAKLTN